MNKWFVILLVLILYMPIAPNSVQAKTCKAAVATSGNWGQDGAAARFQLFMEEILTANRRPMVKLAQNEALSIFNGWYASDMTPLQKLVDLGVCKILFVSIIQTQREIDQDRETVSIGSLGGFLRTFGGKEASDLARVLDAVSVFASRHQVVDAMGFEATAQLIYLPRDLVFSKTIEGSALVARDKSGLVIVGPYSKEHHRITRSEIAGLTLKRIAFEILQLAYAHCQCL